MEIKADRWNNILVSCFSANCGGANKINQIIRLGSDCEIDNENTFLPTYLST